MCACQGGVGGGNWRPVLLFFSGGSWVIILVLPPTPTSDFAHVMYFSGPQFLHLIDDRVGFSHLWAPAALTARGVSFASGGKLGMRPQSSGLQGRKVSQKEPWATWHKE